MMAIFLAAKREGKPSSPLSVIAVIANWVEKK